MKISRVVLTLCVLGSVLIFSGCMTCPMGFEKVESSLIDAVKYDAPADTLVIKFDSGDLYTYTGVPQNIYDAFMAADSQGKYDSSKK